jgi:hypothetical protein
LLPATQLAITNTLIGHLFPGGRAASAHYGWRNAQFSGLRVPVSGGVLSIGHLAITGSWWQLLWKNYSDRQQISVDAIQLLPNPGRGASAPSQPFDLAIDGGVQDFPAEPRRFVGGWKVSAAPRLPASPLPLTGDLHLYTRDPLAPGVQPFALADFSGSLDPAFLWNLSPAGLAAHDQVAQFFALLPISAERQAAALRLIDYPGQFWKIHVSFTVLARGGITWELHATLWGDADLAADFAALHWLAHSSRGAPVVDAAGYSEGPTIVVSGINGQPTSSNFDQLLLQLHD